MVHCNKLAQRGDTLVEVLLAMVVLSVVIVGSSLIINTGMRNAINAVEHTQVRNSIASQSELLRYLRDSAQAGNNSIVTEMWQKIQTELTDTNPPSSVSTCAVGAAKKAFYLTADFLSVNQPPVIAAVNYTNFSMPETFAKPGQGIWIEAVRSTANPPYIDFHIRACWGGVGTTVQQQTNTVVRLYAQ